MSHPTDPGYWLHRPGKVVVEWPDTDPAPMVVNTAPRPEGAPEDPRAVKSLQRAAERAGWAIKVGYSRGMLRTRSVGVYKDVEVIGVWSDSAHGWRFYAMYERTLRPDPDGPAPWKWTSITRWSPAGNVQNMTITNLIDFIGGIGHD